MIECAKDGDGVAEADDYISDLELKARKGNAAALTRAADIAIRFEEYARRGSLRIPRELNELTDDLWEIKVGTTRLPFFKLEGPCYKLIVRLTHGFNKQQQRTPRKHISRAKWIREQDVMS